MENNEKNRIQNNRREAENWNKETRQQNKAVKLKAGVMEI